MRNDNIFSTKTEPIFNNYDLFQGPFQYSPFTIGHPDQPEDDHSVRDPTVKTIDKSKISLSPMHTNQEIAYDKLSFNPEANSFQLFSNFQHNKLLNLQTQSKPIKLKQKFIDIFRKKIKTHEKIIKFKHLFDMEQIDQSRQYVLLPNSVILKTWNIFYYLLIFVYLFIIPISDKSNQIPFLLLKILDCLLNICSAVINNGDIETNNIVILNNYYKTFFFFDITYIISMIIMIKQETIYWIILIINIISILPRFQDLQKKIQYEFNIFQKYQQIVLLMIQQILIIHIITCFWMENLQNEIEEDLSQNYLKTFQLIVGIITFNQNYNNLDDNYKIIAYCCITILSFYYFAFQLSIIIQLFKPNKQLLKLKYFFAKTNLDSTLKQKIISQQINQPKFCHQEFIDKLPIKLLQEYNVLQRKKLLKQQFKYLKNETLKQVIDNCIEIVCQPKEKIFQQGTTDDCSLYLILEGSVHLKSKQNIIILTLNQFAAFGELSFYTEKTRDLTAITDCAARLLKIQRSTFLNILSFNEKQFFYQQRDLALLNERLPSECICCNSHQHLITSCPYLTYIPDVSFILKKYHFPKKQIRKQYERKKNKDTKAYSRYRHAIDCNTAFQNLVSECLQNSQQSYSQIPIEDNHIKDSYVSSFSKISKERSFIKSTSFLKQPSGFDQQSVFNNDNLIQNVDQNNDFQFMHNSSQEYQNDDFSSLARTDQQKRTFNTAGFGSQSVVASNKDMTQNLTQRSLNIIMENEDSDSHLDQDSKYKQNQDEINQDHLIEDKFIRKIHDPKLTFNNNFESQMREQNQTNFQRLGSGSYRRQSSRNSTYLHPEVVSQRLNSSRSLTNSQYKPSLNQSQYIKKTSLLVPQKLMQQSRLLDNFNQDENKSQNLVYPHRKSNTRIGSKVSNITSSFSRFSAQEIPVYANQSFGLDDFDRMYAFENYFTHNNYEVTIYQANKMKNYSKIHFSKYQTDYQLVKMIRNLKQKSGISMHNQ